MEVMGGHLHTDETALGISGMVKPVKDTFGLSASQEGGVQAMSRFVGNNLRIQAPV